MTWPRPHARSIIDRRAPNIFPMEAPTHTQEAPTDVTDADAAASSAPAADEPGEGEEGLDGGKVQSTRHGYRLLSCSQRAWLVSWRCGTCWWSR